MGCAIVAVCSRTAYSLDGGPSWIESDGWDILSNCIQSWTGGCCNLSRRTGPECIAEICLVANCPELPGIFPTYSNLKCNCCQPSGLWNLFRLENEHLHNVVKYRAFKPVPLPFDYNVG
uniref:Uncharacterized protein n=1 Tax=Populus alba TaxID=43335 RepID=A0A4U5QH26_POPAL|nr:hypothetical protein D5086_0000089240 [Populus alba]